MKTMVITPLIILLLTIGNTINAQQPEKEYCTLPHNVFGVIIVIHTSQEEHICKEPVCPPLYLASTSAWT